MPNFRGSPRIIRRTLPLGTGAVSTGTFLLGFSEVKGRVTAIRYGGQAAVTGTAITAEVKKTSTDGNTDTTLQSAATDIKLTASTDETKIAASLTTTQQDLNINKDQLLQVVITCTAITAGPGDVVVEVVVDPRA